jgi:hypothetical protein
LGTGERNKKKYSFLLIAFSQLPITHHQSPLPFGVAIFLPENDEKEKSYIDH